MTPYCLYGETVYSDMDLFNRAVPPTAVAPGERHALNFRRLPEDIALPQLPEATFLARTRHREVWLHSDHQPGSNVQGQWWRMRVAGLVDFYWSSGEPDVYYQVEAACSAELLVFWFVHIVLPFYLALERSYDFIHAAAVEVDESPVLFIAPSAGGKSTLGDFFLQRGHQMLSDDKVATLLHDGTFYAVPSHPHHRPFRQVEVLGHPIERFATRARPIHACYVLERDEPHSATCITELQGFRKFEQLAPHYLFEFDFLLERRLHWLARLADRTRVFRVRRPWNLARMPEVYEVICQHSRSLTQIDSSYQTKLG